ncbi:Uncharacterised protein [Mycobacteroides abscessus subsp. abscessus]|nr:Uncharacterised protein [Mycobacteroides abscessus subsp. abscessus]
MSFVRSCRTSASRSFAKLDMDQKKPKDSQCSTRTSSSPRGALGGYKDPLTYGDWQVNNALGTLTKQQKDAVRAWLETQDPNAIVNIRITGGE